MEELEWKHLDCLACGNTPECEDCNEPATHVSVDSEGWEECRDLNFRNSYCDFHYRFFVLNVLWAHAPEQE